MKYSKPIIFYEKEHKIFESEAALSESYVWGTRKGKRGCESTEGIAVFGIYRQKWYRKFFETNETLFTKVQ